MGLVTLVRKDNIIRDSTSQDLGSAVLDYTTSFSKFFRLLQVLIHFSGSTSETIEVVKDSGVGSNYDTVLESEAVTTVTDWIFRPSGQCIFLDDDEAKITCTATGSTTAYVIIEVEEL